MTKPYTLRHTDVLKAVRSDAKFDRRVSDLQLIPVDPAAISFNPDTGYRLQIRYSLTLRSGQTTRMVGPFAMVLLTTAGKRVVRGLYDCRRERFVSDDEITEKFYEHFGVSQNTIRWRGPLHQHTDLAYVVMQSPKPTAEAVPVKPAGSKTRNVIRNFIPSWL